MTQSSPERRFSKLAAAINQKAIRLGARGRITAADLFWVFVRAKQKCEYCGVELNWQGVSFDHAQAFARGGSNSPENLASSCITCQRGKFVKTPSEWAQARGLLVQCEVDGVWFKPRWADYQRGFGRTCSRKCSGTKGGQAESVHAG